MNPLNCSAKKIAPRWLFITLATLVLLCRAAAQPTTEPPQRWLFIFDTSAAMKPRQPALIAELKNLFIHSMSGQMHAGDSIGVWTFDRKINAGTFPLATWTPQLAVVISSNIITYLGQQHYAGNTTFAALKPALTRVIDNSERLTIIIFSDGEDTIKLTPYDDGINQAFTQGKAERASLNQSFALVIRTQRGEFIGATVNLPPGFLDLPAFPPLPLPPATSDTPTNPPPVIVIAPAPVPPAVSLPPLVIVGTNVGTNINDLPKTLPPPRITVTNAPVAAMATNAIITNTNEIAATVTSNPPTTLAPATNLPVTESEKNQPAAVIISQTPTVASATNNTLSATNGGDNRGDNGTRNLILIGLGLLAAAVTLGFFLALQRPRAARESLITSSMQNEPRPPAKK